MNKFEIIIVSLPEKERLVAEIYYDNMYWVQISQETDELIIQFYAHPTQKYWEFPLDEALGALQQAKKRFLGMGGYKT